MGNPRFRDSARSLGASILTLRSAVIAAIVAASAIYGLNRGIFVGTERYVRGFECCPDAHKIIKRCRCLFITGVSEIDARDGIVQAPRARTDPAALQAALALRDNGYCSIFSE